MGTRASESAASIKKLEQSLLMLNETMKGLQNEITGLKTSVGSLVSTQTDIDKSIAALTKRFTNVEDSIQVSRRQYDELKTNYNRLFERIISQESYSKRENLIFEGIPEPQNGTKDDCEKLIKDVLVNKLKIKNAQQIRFDRCHRMTRSFPSNNADSRPQTRPRAIIARFNYFGDRQRVWQERKKLKGTKMFINEDFAKEIVERRKTLTPIMKAAHRNGYSKAYLVVDKLHIEKDSRHHVYDVNTLNKLPADLDPNYVTTEKKDNVLYFFGSSCPLSNFHPSPFRCDGKQFRWVEQFFFHRKAELADDQVALRRLMDADTPAKCKSIGYHIKCDQEVWNRERIPIMEKAIREKFGQNPHLKDFLIKTGELILAEASPTDRFWGTGVGLWNRSEGNHRQWPGINKLGDLLMALRTQLK